MEKQRASDTERLSNRQITPADFVRLIDTLAPGVQSLTYFANWKSGDEASGESLDDLRDPSKLEDFAGLSLVGLTFRYSDDNRVAATFSSGTVRLSWTGAVGADKARRFRHTWESLPGEGKLRANRWTYTLRNTLAVALVTGWTLEAVFIILKPRSAIWPACVALALLGALWPLQFRIIRRESAPPPSRDQPFVLERDIANGQWSDAKHRTTVLVGIGGIAATVLAGVATVIVTLMTAKR